MVHASSEAHRGCMRAYRAARPDVMRSYRVTTAAVAAEMTRSGCRRYWVVNGETIRASRRRKYAEDPVYRGRILASNRASKQRAKERAHGAS